MKRVPRRGWGNQEGIGITMRCDVPGGGGYGGGQTPVGVSQTGVTKNSAETAASGGMGIFAQADATTGGTPND
jgi:hypothetical protein